MLVKSLKHLLNVISGKYARLDSDLMRHAQLEYGKDWQHAYHMLKEQAEMVK